MHFYSPLYHIKKTNNKTNKQKTRRKKNWKKKSSPQPVFDPGPTAHHMVTCTNFDMLKAISQSSYIIKSLVNK